MKNFYHLSILMSVMLFSNISNALPTERCPNREISTQFGLLNGDYYRCIAVDGYIKSRSFVSEAQLFGELKPLASDFMDKTYEMFKQAKEEDRVRPVYVATGTEVVTDFSGFRFVQGGLFLPFEVEKDPAKFQYVAEEVAIKFVKDMQAQVDAIEQDLTQKAIAFLRERELIK